MSPRFREGCGYDRAGDAFNAGFAVALMRGFTVAHSAVFASAVAAISVTRPGAQPSMPSGRSGIFPGAAFHGNCTTAFLYKKL